MLDSPSFEKKNFSTISSSFDFIRQNKRIMQNHHRIQFPKQETTLLGQDEVSFQLIEEDRKVRLRFHDYGQIYRRKDLYEQLFYDRLKCVSPGKVVDLLKSTVDRNGRTFTELRVLDLGAGNGMVGEALKKFGVARMIGADIIPEAKVATMRDRPGVYDEYFVADFTDLDEATKVEINDWSIDCLTSVAALGFGDIPPSAFLQALEFVTEGGWAAFNIKETFLDNSDESGFSRMIRELISSEYLDIHHLERYRHRLSMEGTPLYYFALIAQKVGNIPHDFLRQHGITPN
jgi:SAM-dependent methyltransferase